MNLDTWPDMTPAERDMLVAEYVMGWHRVQKLKRNGGFPYWADEADQIRSQCQDWFPSTDISAAMEVVDRMTADLWQYYFEGHATWHKAVFWKQADDGKEVRRLEAGAHGQHRCDNICLAALKAKETENG